MKDDIDDIIQYYLDPSSISLTKAQKEKMEMYQMAWGLCNQYSKNTVRKLMAVKFQISESLANKRIIEMERFYGGILVYNREFKTALYIENLERLARKAEDKGDYGFAIKALAEAAELGDLKNAKALPDKKGNNVYMLTINMPENRIHQLKLDGRGALDSTNITTIVAEAVEVNQDEQKMLNQFNEYYGEEG